MNSGIVSNLKVDSGTAPTGLLENRQDNRLGRSGQHSTAQNKRVSGFFLRHRGTNFLRNLLDMAQVQLPITQAGCTDTHKGNIGLQHCRDRVDCGVKPTGPIPLGDKLIHARLDDGASPAFYHLHLSRIHVYTNDAMAHGSEARGRHRTDVTQTKYTNREAHSPAPIPRPANSAAAPFSTAQLAQSSRRGSSSSQYNNTGLTTPGGHTHRPLPAPKSSLDDRHLLTLFSITYSGSARIPPLPVTGRVNVPASPQPRHGNMDSWLPDGKECGRASAGCVGKRFARGSVRGFQSGSI